MGKPLPIERHQFDAEQDTLTMKVLDHLQKNKRYAFTSKEIAERLHEDPLDVLVILNRLFEADEVIERKKIDGEYYFALKKIISRLVEMLF